MDPTLTSSWISSLSNHPVKGVGGTVQNWMRNQFAANYAKGGWMAEAYAPTAGARVKASLRGNFGDIFGLQPAFEIKAGSPQHLRNLEAMKSAPGANIAKIDKAIAKVAKNSGKISGLGIASKAFGPVMWAGSIGMGVASAGPGFENKMQGAVRGTAYAVGWDVGSFVGGIAGAAVGGLPGVLIGKAAGGLLGAAAGEALVSPIINRANAAVERTRGRRRSELINSTEAFNTEKAYTMRQQSLSMMNRGQNVARSLMGKEASVIHQ
jgi:hypothetical protein